jgi:hypothetical protein
MPFDYRTCIDFDEGFMPLIFGMDMGRWMIIMIHPNGDPKKVRNDWHIKYVYKQKFNVELRDAARLYRAASLWSAGLGYFFRYVDEKLNGLDFALNESVFPSYVISTRNTTFSYAPPFPASH